MKERIRRNFTQQAKKVVADLTIEYESEDGPMDDDAMRERHKVLMAQAMDDAEELTASMRE